jgi:hypothetical protein
MRKEARERWSARVTRESRALALEEGVFTRDDPRRIAASLERSAEASRSRKGTPFQSAMSMLNFYINRAGRSLPRSRLVVLGRAKEELRDLFGRGPEGRRGRGGPTR